MKKYTIHLILLSVLMLVASLASQGIQFFSALPVWTLPVMVVYFSIIDIVEYWLTSRSITKSPKGFVQFFLGMTVAILFLHLILITIGVLSHPSTGKNFAIAFMIYYVVYTVFVIAEIIVFMRRFGNNPDKAGDI